MRDGGGSPAGLVEILFESGLGLGALVVLYRVLAPWVAATLKRQQERAERAEDALEARLARTEGENASLRAEKLELVRSAAGWEARATEAASARDILQAHLEAAQGEREAAAAELAHAQRELGELRDEVGRLRLRAEGG